MKIINNYPKSIFFESETIKDDIILMKLLNLYENLRKDEVA
jgi:hypothetical protein